AFHFSRLLVVGEGDGAVLTLEGLAASTAEDYGRVAAAIEQHHHLLAALEAILNFLRELAGDDLFVPGFLEFLAHVEELDFGQGAVLYAVGELEKSVLVLSCIEIRFQGRSGGAEHDDRIGHLGAHDGDIAGMIARHFLLLVGGVLLLVDDDEREVTDGRENGGARADHDAGFPLANAVPLLGALSVGESGMEDSNLVSEDLM